jgi:hypothetical protein
MSPRVTKIEGPPLKTPNNRSVGSAAVVQSSLDEGRCDQAGSTNQAKVEAPRPKVNYEAINSFIEPQILSKSWSGSRYRGPYFLPPLPHVAVNHTRIAAAGKLIRNRLEWFDPITGVGGVGEISLAVHILKVSEDEAAWRLAQWLAAKSGCGIADFLDGEPANG